jgi:hypothetical protein
MNKKHVYFINNIFNKNYKIMGQKHEIEIPEGFEIRNDDLTHMVIDNCIGGQYLRATIPIKKIKNKNCITTYEGLCEFSSKLIMANIEIPENFKLHLTKEEQKEFLPDRELISDNLNKLTSINTQFHTFNIHIEE